MSSIPAAKVHPKPIRRLRRLLWQIARRLRDTLTVKTQQGLLTVFSADKVIGKSLYCRGEYELDWVRRVARLLDEHGRLSRQGTVLDIGANMGVISIGMLLDGLFEKAIALEPDPANFALLGRNIRQNDLEARFACLAHAASDREAKLEFELSGDNYGDHRIRMGGGSGAERYDESGRKVIEVPAAPLDRLLGLVPAEFAERVALVWIDVQGHEGQVFKGGERFFRRDIPVQAEIWPYGIRRAGMEARTFCALAQELWPYYWLLENDSFVRHPIADLPALFAEFGEGNRSTNVVFARF